MNERWVELCEEAEKYALSKVNSAGYCFETNMYIGRLTKMKLAELIIQECIEIVLESDPSPKMSLQEPYATIMFNIKDHFGVE